VPIPTWLAQVAFRFPNYLPGRQAHLVFRATAAFGGAEATALVTILSNRSVAFRDVLSDAFGASTNTSGAIVVEVASGKATPIVTSRTFNDAGTKGTFGQYIPAIPLGPSPSGDALIEGLGGDAPSRSNVGVLNLTEASIDATITVRDENGVARGNPILFPVPAQSGSPTGITAGPNRTVWVTDESSNNLVCIGC